MTLSSPTSTPPDIVDQSVPLSPGQATHALRQQRAKVQAATQASYEGLFSPEVQGLSLTERLLVGLHASHLCGAHSLAAHYRARLVEEWAPALLVEAAGQVPAGAVDDARIQTILAFTATLIQRPLEGDRAAIQTLLAAGLSTPAIVALGQLIAFLSYQVRLTAGLQALAALEAAA